MKALQYDAYRAQPQVVEVPSPACPPDGALVEVRATGVCRSDWHAWQGHDPVELPCIPGHEYAGVVTAVGSEVRHWARGDRVTAPFVLGCGECEYCAAGDAQICPDQRQPGFTDPGSFAELVAVPRADFNLVQLPESVDFITAAALGCRFATAFRALTAHGNVARGQWVCVHGCGGVGLSAIMIAVALGARVVAVDVSPTALARAQELGAEHSIQADEVTDVASAVIARTAGGAHISIDAIGNPDAARASVNCLRPRGRHVQVGLLLQAAANTPLPMDRVVALELEIHGSHGMAAHEYPVMLELIETGALQPQRLVGRTIGLDAAGQALRAMGAPPATPAGSGHGGITVIVPESVSTIDA